MACNVLGHISLDRGDAGQAIHLAERSVHLCQTWDFPNPSIWAASLLGAAYTLDGRPADAVPLLEQALEKAAARNVVAGYPRWAIWLGEAYLATDRIADVNKIATSALDAALNRKERGNQAYARRLLGQIAARRQPPDPLQAETHYQDALTLAQELGMRPLEAHCHLHLGKLYRHLHRPADARTHLSQATQLLRDMQMLLWLPGAESELAEISLPPSAEPVH